ncbi:hypothetical protein [Neptuniibacter sp. QD37_11]|uniref:hypothetical protein n=1 Tax=Neptuniibacter sp. QD37_11 TaxID=3398209 RepID=UPI0039F5D615
MQENKPVVSVNEYVDQMFDHMQVLYYQCQTKNCLEMWYEELEAMAGSLGSKVMEAKTTEEMDALQDAEAEARRRLKAVRVLMDNGRYSPVYIIPNNQFLVQ